jgi:hypothetical protein
MTIRLTTFDKSGTVTAVSDSRYNDAASGWKAARATFTSFETSSKSSRLMTALRAGKKVPFNSGMYEMEVVEG